MKIRRKNEALKIANSPVCMAFEYPMECQNINGAVNEITGRYPEQNRVMNTLCHELVYVLGGSGKLVLEDAEYQIDEGDMLLVEPNEKYFWQGNLKLFTACVPAWHPEQHKEVA